MVLEVGVTSATTVAAIRDSFSSTRCNAYNLNSDYFGSSIS